MTGMLALASFSLLLIASPWLIGGLVVLGLVLLALVIVFISFGNLWFQAYMSSADVSMWSLIGMSFRQVNSRTIVTVKVMANVKESCSDNENGSDSEGNRV